MDCYPPVGSFACGVYCPPPTPCQTDVDCEYSGQETTCVNAQCSCIGDASDCPPACGPAADCVEGQLCSGNQCVAQPCSTFADCPGYFTCEPTDAGSQCQRMTCTSDSDCTYLCAEDYACQGTCVYAACYAMPGGCRMMHL
jgi:hypothetical protein